MKFTLEINLGNDAMQTGTDIIVGGVLWDVNGNTVGKWKVVSQ